VAAMLFAAGLIVTQYAWAEDKAADVTDMQALRKRFRPTRKPMSPRCSISDAEAKNSGRSTCLPGVDSNRHGSWSWNSSLCWTSPFPALQDVGKRAARQRRRGVEAGTPAGDEGTGTQKASRYLHRSKVARFTRTTSPPFLCSNKRRAGQ
jgi:hypothetical protein